MAKPGTLKPDHHVRTAEGMRYVVRYVHAARDGEPEHADLQEYDGSDQLGDYIVLPTAELRRVAVATLPTITGLPDDRPRCVMCDRLLKPDTDYEYAKRPGGSAIYTQILKRTFKRWRGYWANATGDEMFCTQRCAITFARAAFKAGYRIQRKRKRDVPR